MKSQILTCIVFNIWQASKSVTNGRMRDERTDGQKKTNMPHQSFQSWGHKEALGL